MNLTEPLFTGAATALVEINESVNNKAAIQLFALCVHSLGNFLAGGTCLSHFGGCENELTDAGGEIACINRIHLLIKLACCYAGVLVAGGHFGRNVEVHQLIAVGKLGGEKVDIVLNGEGCCGAELSGFGGEGINIVGRYINTVAVFLAVLHNI